VFHCIFCDLEFRTFEPFHNHKLKCADTRVGNLEKQLDLLRKQVIMLESQNEALQVERFEQEKKRGDWESLG